MKSNITNKEIAASFRLLGNIMELKGENPFKIRSYQNAYLNLRKLETPLATMEESEIAALKGVGKAIVGKIKELVETGSMSTLERYKSETPEGVQEMLNIKGFGPKKIRVIWKELGVESIGELLYAVNENRLIELKGFGPKTQEDLKQKLEYYQKSKSKFLFRSLHNEAQTFLKKLRSELEETRLELTGAIRRAANTLDQIELLTITEKENIRSILEKVGASIQKEEEKMLAGLTSNDLPFCIYFCQPEEFGSKQFRYTGAKAFLDAFVNKYNASFTNIPEEQGVFDKAGIPFIVPELREDAWSLDLAAENKLPQLISIENIKGVLHTHSTYSDGIHSLKDMAEYTKSCGYEYLGITDHSQSAFYANGLKEDRVLQQFEEVDQLNQALAPFKIFKGIESDILNDGRLDYEGDLLKQFDFIVASVHSNLRMDKQKATNRLIKAIENPYTTILGHPTGRLLLSRRGYPIDHKKVIDACAANGVVIELNANPYRLDIDWSWIPYALEKGVKIAINPDAHSKDGIHDIQFGIASARKGGLTKETCLNTLSLKDFEQYIGKK